mmetsp:Transcript_17358/g.40296  ORF Transcript_17358/g.40296 Transcript_17358/m.40296 type:complete len:226 (-) Transcript_17358:312-989(-)
MVETQSGVLRCEVVTKAAISAILQKHPPSTMTCGLILVGTHADENPCQPTIQISFCSIHQQQMLFHPNQIYTLSNALSKNTHHEYTESSGVSSTFYTRTCVELGNNNKREEEAMKGVTHTLHRLNMILPMMRGHNIRLLLYHSDHHHHHQKNRQMSLGIVSILPISAHLLHQTIHPCADPSILASCSHYYCHPHHFDWTTIMIWMMTWQVDSSRKRWPCCCEGID